MPEQSACWSRTRCRSSCSTPSSCCSRSSACWSSRRSSRSVSSWSWNSAASWLKDPASRPENSTGKNLRIWFLQGLGSGNTASLVANAMPALLRRFDRLIARQLRRARRGVVLVRPGVGVHGLAPFLGNGRRATGSPVDPRALQQFFLFLLLPLGLRLLLGRLGLALRQGRNRYGEEANDQ